MVKALSLAGALAVVACNPSLPSGIPCDSNDNCPEKTGCDLTARVCREVQGCDNLDCFQGNPNTPSVTFNPPSGAKLTFNQGNVPNNTNTFAVLRATDQSGPYSIVGTAPIGSQTITFTDPGPLDPGKTYWYEVAASYPDNIVGRPSPPASLAVPHWGSRASMLTARLGLGMAQVNGLLYAIGGSPNLGALGANEAYDPATNTWATKLAMPTPRSYLGVAALNGIIYAAGGQTNTASNVVYDTVEAYDPSHDTWTTKAHLPSPTANLALAADATHLFAVGGNGATALVYDPTGNSWSPLPPMPTARDGVGAAVLNGILYVVGGVNSGAARVGTAEAYDPAANTWSVKAPMTIARQGPAVGVLNGILYALGGTSGTGAYATVESYDPSTNTWTTRDSMSTTRAFGAAAAAGGLLYTAGGFTSNGIAIIQLEAFAP
jgi:kelch-like protein 17 (actinfilin)